MIYHISNGVNREMKKEGASKNFCKVALSFFALVAIGSFVFPRGFSTFNPLYFFWLMLRKFPNAFLTYSLFSLILFRYTISYGQIQ